MRAVVITKHGGPGGAAGRGAPRPAGRARRGTDRGQGGGDQLRRPDGAGRGSTRTRPSRRAWSATRSRATSSRSGEGGDGLAVGDRVMAATRFGGYAELVAVAGGQTLPLPDALQLRAGRRVPGQLRDRVGRRCSVMGGLKRGRAGADPRRGRRGRDRGDPDRRRRAAPRSSGPPRASKHDAIREQGVAHAIDYRASDFADEVMRITCGEGVDVVIDAIGPRAPSARTTGCCARAGG